MNLYRIDWQFEDAGEFQYRSNENVDFDDSPHHVDIYSIDVYFEVLRFLENLQWVDFSKGFNDR